MFGIIPAPGVLSDRFRHNLPRFGDAIARMLHDRRASVAHLNVETGGHPRLPRSTTFRGRTPLAGTCQNGRSLLPSRPSCLSFSALNLRSRLLPIRHIEDAGYPDDQAGETETRSVVRFKPRSWLL